MVRGVVIFRTALVITVFNGGARVISTRILKSKIKLTDLKSYKYK